MQDLAKEFRDRASQKFGGARHRTRYPDDLKALGRRFIGQARQAGVEEQDIAAALGVSSATTRAWVPTSGQKSPGQSALPRPRLVRVVDGAEGVEHAAPVARYLVRGPRGLTIECDARGVAQLWLALS